MDTHFLSSSHQLFKQPARLLVAGLLAAGLTATAHAAPAQTGKAPGVATSDALFIRTAGQASKAEVELAKLVDDRSTNPDVKALADSIRHDHGQANDDFAKLATQKGVTIPDISVAAKANWTRLSSLKGIAFDKAFIAQMVTDHENAVSSFTTESKTKDADLQPWVDKMIPVLKDHLQRAKDLKATLSK